MNGSPKTSVNTAVNTVLTHAPGKTRVYLQKTGYTREIPGSASMPRAPYSQGPCATAARTACSSMRTAPCALASCRCQKAASALRQARLAGGGADDAVVPTFCFNIEAVLGMRFCEPEQLIARRSRCTPRGRACRRSTRLLLASTPYRTPPTSAPAVCIACSCVPLHSGARRPACMQHKQTAHRCRSSRCGQSQHTAQRVRGRVAAGVTTLDSGGAPSKNSRPTRPHLTERVNTSRGAVLTRLNTSTAVVLTVNV